MSPGLLPRCLLALALTAMPALAAEVPASQQQMQLSFSPLVKATAPAVVNVYVTRRVKEFVSPFGSDPFFREFFGGDVGVPRERMENSLGSGVIVSEDGLIMTNNHVVKGGGDAEIRVALADKREFDARIILRDEKLDLAVLRLTTQERKFPHLDFDDSDAVDVGDLVLAIGDPFGVGQTVTSGIISALARGRGNTADAQYFIQTDAAINPGNSGGALINMNGKLIGINTAIVSRSGGSQGIGLAIPSNLVKVFLTSAITGKAIAKPWLGAALMPVTREIAQTLKLEKVTGVLVADVDPSGPAAKAGLAPQDVVIGIDGALVEDAAGLAYRLDTKGVGATAKLVVLRDGKQVSLDLPLVEAPQPVAVNLTGPHPFDGAKVSDVALSTLGRNATSTDVSGVAIIDVQTGSIAQSLGFRPGDVVVRVNRYRVRGVGDLQRLLKNPQRVWRLDVKRGDQIYQMTVPG